MLTIPTPKTVKFNKQTDNQGRFIIEPLYPGYGITLGNALRRVMLSSIPGAAITSVKIKGVDHEFSTIPYVKEDVVDILLNIKQVNLSIEGPVDSDEPLTIKLKKIGEGKVVAGDFECPSQVKIANKNCHLATLTDAAVNLEMECLVDKGIGYLPVENRPGEKLDIGHIAVDAIFTPIEYVNMQTENVRVGEMTNWDKLIIDLKTNGAISCQDAFDLAVDILGQQFDSLRMKDEQQKNNEPEEEKVNEPDVPPGEPFEQLETSNQNHLVDQQQDSQPAEQVEKKKRGRPKKEDN